jgi:uncharacterized protein YukE
MNDVDQITALARTISGNSWVASGLSVGGGLSALDSHLNPTSALSSAGLGWLTSLVKPLEDALGRMTGKASVVQTFASAWQQVSTTVNQIQQQHARAAQTNTARWQGTAADSYRAQAAQVTAALQQISALAGATSSATTTVGQAVAAGRQQANNQVTQMVQKLIQLVTQSTALSGGLNPAIVAKATSLISSYAKSVATIEQQIQQTTSHLRPLLNGIAAATTTAHS